MPKPTIASLTAELAEAERNSTNAERRHKRALSAKDKTIALLRKNAEYSRRADMEAKPSKNDGAEGGRILGAGTVLPMGDRDITLVGPVAVHFAGEESEATFVGMCAISRNLDANKQSFRFRYDGLGQRLPLAEQVDDEKDMPEFIASLTEEEAASFGIDAETWKGYAGVEDDD